MLSVGWMLSDMIFVGFLIHLLQIFHTFGLAHKQVHLCLFFECFWRDIMKN